MVYNMMHDMVHDLRKNTAAVQVFFCGALVHQKSTQGARNIVHQNFKFSEPCSTSQPCLQIIFILSPYSNPMIFFSDFKWFTIIFHDP